MSPQNLQCSISVPLPPMEVFEKISRIGEWWAVNFKGSATNLHDQFTVHFARTTWALMEIVEADPGRRVIWKVVECYLPIFKDPYVWKNNLIAWEIVPDGNLTRVTMTHIGLFPGVECYEDCSKGWGFYIGESLQKLLTEGRGLPGSGIFADIFVADRRYEGLLFSRMESFPEYADGYVLVDVQENRGERVLSAYSVSTLNIRSMSPQDLQGEYYMILENHPVHANVQPLDDLCAIIPCGQ